ncbi:MAG: DMT family transporter [Kiritimatiellia bacterium]|jgi:drug/metabolite transporter (DMT)-like permease
MLRRGKLVGLGLGLLATVFWASLYSVTRLLFGNFEVDPLTLTFLRFLMASVFFVGVAIVMGRGRDLLRALRRDGLAFIFLGLTGVFAEGALQFYSLQYTTGMRSCVFSNASPILTVLIAALWLKEPITRRMGIGMIVGLAAMILGLAGQPGSDQFMESSSYLGDFLALMSAVCWSLYTVGGDSVTKRYGGLISASSAMLTGTVITLVFLLITGRPVFPSMPPQVWWGMVYLGVGASGVAYVAWFSALKYLKAGELGAFGYVSTMIAAVLSILLVKERFPVTFVIAIIGVLLGVWLMTAPERKREPRMNTDGHG